MNPFVFFALCAVLGTACFSMNVFVFKMNRRSYFLNSTGFAIGLTLGFFLGKDLALVVAYLIIAFAASAFGGFLTDLVTLPKAS